MTVENIMSQDQVKLKPTDRVCDASNIMHDKQIRNLPVVDDDDQFVGLFGIWPLLKILLPEAGKIKMGLQDLSFMPYDVDELLERLEKIVMNTVVDKDESNPDAGQTDPCRVETDVSAEDSGVP